MKLGMQVGLGRGHSVGWGSSSPPPKGHNPQFSANICCGQMAGWINMPLGREVGLGPPKRHCVRWGPAPPQKGGRAPISCPCLLWPNGWMDQYGTWHGDRHRSRPYCGRWGHSSHSHPNFRSVFIVAKRLDGSRCHLVWRWVSAEATLCEMGIQLALKRGTASNFPPMPVVTKRLDASRCHFVRR